ncbi:MAG: hypothetical protein NT033_03705 [Candidatus Omnitrophica bacterium]|nr:hypothetical protein [Candidatus Omnitrophota bacterium]
MPIKLLNMKHFLRKIGKFIIILSQKDEHQVRQSVLVVDGGHLSAEDFALIVTNAKDKFRNANLVVLTQQDREDFIKNNFPEAEIISAEKIAKINNFKLAISLVLLLRKNYKFIVLSTLDASLVFISLAFGRCPVFLRNRWEEWHSLRQKSILDVLKGKTSMDRRETKNRGPRGLLKTIGRYFVIIADLDEIDTRSPILLVDNGYTDMGHVSTAVRRAYVNFINPDITVLTFAARKHYFVSMFPQAKLVVLEELDKKCSLDRQLYRMRKEKFSHIILTTLDIPTLFVAIAEMKAKVLLYNKWHQWWSLDYRNIWGYLKKPFSFLIIIPIFIYLLIKVTCILLRTLLRLVFKDLKAIILKRKEGVYETI